MVWPCRIYRPSLCPFIGEGLAAHLRLLAARRGLGGGGASQGSPARTTLWCARSPVPGSRGRLHGPILSASGGQWPSMV